MISHSEFSKEPLRQGESDACLLASYAAAAFPFVKIAELAYFADIARLRGENEDAPLEVPPQIVDPRIGVVRLGSGYDWIEQLHNSCPGLSFERTRLAIQTSRLHAPRNLESALNAKRCTALLTINPNRHSIAVGCDPDLGFFARDSAKSGDAPYDAAASGLEELLQVLYPTGVSVGESILLVRRVRR